MTRRVMAVSVGWLGLSMISDAVPVVLVPHRVLLDGGDASALGLITLVAITVAAALQPVAGFASDHLGRVRVIVVGSLVAVAGIGLLLVPGAALPAAVVSLAGASIAQGAQQALLPEHVDRDWRGRAGGLKGAFDVGGAFVGFGLLAVLLSAGRLDVAIAALALGLGASAVATLLLLRSIAGRSPERPPIGHTPAGRPSLVVVAAARFLFLLGIFVVGRFLVLFVAERLGVAGDAAAGAASGLIAILALVTALASVPGGWLSDRLGRRMPMALGGLLAAAGIGLLASSASVGAMLAPGLLMAIGTALFGSASWAAQADAVARTRAGRLLGLANLGTAGAAAVAGLAGPAIDAIGFEAAFAAAAAVSLLGGLLPLVGVGPLRTTLSRPMVEEP